MDEDNPAAIIVLGATAVGVFGVYVLLVVNCGFDFRVPIIPAQMALQLASFTLSSLLLYSRIRSRLVLAGYGLAVWVALLFGLWVGPDV